MALIDTLRSAIAKAIVPTLRSGGLVVTVQRLPYAGPGLNGRDTYAPPVDVPDVLLEDEDAKSVKAHGTDVVIRAKLTIFDPALIVNAKDRWILPDGREMGAAIIRPGVVPTDGGRILTQVLLG